MMKRDMLDNALKQKLHDYSQEPPKDLWASIESDLAASASASKLPIEPTRERGRVVSLRRNILRYGVAASMLIAAATIGIMHSRQPIEVADLVEEVAQPQNDAPRSIPEVEQQIAQQITTQTERAIRTTPALKRVATSTSVEFTEANDDKIVSKRTVTQKQTAEVKPEHEQKTATSKQKSQTPDWYNEIDKPTSRKKRRAPRMSSSLYAANLGIGSSNVNISSQTAPRTLSEFMVRETNMVSGLATPISMEYKPESLRHHAPLSFGVSFSWSIGRNFDIETGLTYTYLKSDAETDGSLFSYKQKQELHYMGVSVSVKYNALNRTHWAVYARGGAMIERGMYGKFSTKYTQGEIGTDGNGSSRIDMNGVQASLSVGLGVEYKFIKSLGIYVEPGVNYYFENNSQPCSYRTENPVHFALKAGLRVNFK